MKMKKKQTERSRQLEETINSLIKKKVDYEEIPSLNPENEKGIKAIVYDGVRYHGKNTQIFAYYGKPLIGGEKLPAILLLHGGGGHAFSNWVKEWNERGYIALAIDTVGELPINAKAGEIGNKELWKRELPACLLHRNGILGPENDEMRHVSEELEEQWIYHGVCAAILAHNILKSDKDVDAEKIGVNGISWGGVLTSLLLGYDAGFLYAIPVYGNGYMSRGLGIVDRFFQNAHAESLWYAEERFDRTKAAILWIGGDEDGCFSVVPKGLSYLATVENNPKTKLCLKHRMQHGHQPGWEPCEIERFADSMTGKSPELPSLQTVLEGETVCIKVKLDQAFHLQEGSIETVESARLLYLEEPMLYEKFEKYEKGNCINTLREYWKEQICAVRDNCVTVKIPDSAQYFYVEVVTKWKQLLYTVTTQFFERC